MGCEKEYNGNYTVSIHKVYIDISQIIRILNFRYWFKCGADFVYLIEGCGKTMSEINVPNTPHPDRYEKTEDRISSYP